MDKDTEFTPMVFRVWVHLRRQKGEVIALMPTLPGDYNPATCTSYMHVGQHSTAHYAGVIAATRPATQEEFMPLVEELESLGYRVLRVQRSGYKHFKIRAQAIKEAGA